MAMRFVQQLLSQPCRWLFVRKLTAAHKQLAYILKVHVFRCPFAACYLCNVGGCGYAMLVAAA